MPGETLMVQGTSSSAGKSLLVTGLCRFFSRRGVRVAPFKAQNMSNNAAVCANGTEIGRSQALQAMAASAAPHPDMNPILLKPEGDTRSQVIVNGRPTHSLEAADYHARKENYWKVVTSALDRLRDQNELVIIEGAGSPAELNLADVELVNMAVARYCRSPVILVGDIERGGVFAQLLGTLWLLPPQERMLVKGLVVNKFRGDLRLFAGGTQLLESRGKVPVLGVMPWIDGLMLPEEDAATLTDNAMVARHANSLDETALNIAVVHLPHIANFDDFDPLSSERIVRLRYVRSMEQLGTPDAIVLPGTKNTLDDLNWLRTTGLADRIISLARQGAAVVGICGGYQMLGHRLHNPDRLENNWHSADGLRLLDVETTFLAEKRTYQVTAEIIDDAMAPGMLHQRLSGYEIHMGQTRSGSAWLKRVRIDGDANDAAFDGARSEDGRVWGCYVHGLFHNDGFRSAWLRSLGAKTQDTDEMNASDMIERSLNRLADALESHLDMNRLEEIIWNKEHLKANV